MNPAPPTDRPLSPALAGLLLALGIVLAYMTGFRGVFVFDDLHAIVDNPTIRDLSRPGQVLLAPAEGGTIGGRPVVNLTLALNHAAGGLDPRGYHAVNLLIHVLAGLTLFGLVRRTLLRLPRFAADALPLALAVAALWALHPLQTAAVTYLVQRAESLMGLFYLLTLYCFVRGTAPDLGGPASSLAPLLRKREQARWPTGRLTPMVRIGIRLLPPRHGHQGGHGLRPAARPAV